MPSSGVSAGDLRCALFDTFLVQVQCHTPFFNTAFPFPGAFSNFSFHCSSCLNIVIACKALGFPCSGSAPPASSACNQPINFTSKDRSKGAYLNDFWLCFEYSSSERRLPSIIQRIWICSMLDQKFDKWCMAVVGCEHDLAKISSESREQEGK